MDPIYTSQNSQSDKPVKRSKLHRIMDFIVLVPLLLLIFLVFGLVPISQYIDPYGGGLGSSVGFGIFIGGIFVVTFPVLAILSLLGLYWELRYIKRNNLSKKELFKAPSFYSSFFVVATILWWITVVIITLSQVPVVYE